MFKSLEKNVTQEHIRNCPKNTCIDGDSGGTGDVHFLSVCYILHTDNHLLNCISGYTDAGEKISVVTK